MEVYEQKYLDLLQDVLDNGEDSDDRTGVGTKSVFGRQIRFAANNPFPLLTTKKVHFDGIVHELLWFISGDTNIKYLVDNNVNIWREWANENGDLGPVYGHQWRKWKSIEIERIAPNTHGQPPLLKVHETEHDQLKNAIERIKSHPKCRRNIVSAWNVGDLDKMALHPCHSFFQFYVRSGKYLDLHLYQRSADWCIGIPYNMASYALLNCMIAQVTGLEAGEVIHTIGDCHVYKNHFDGAKEQLSRTGTQGPMIMLDKSVTDIDDFKFEHVNLFDYNHQPFIKFPIAV